MAECTAIDYTAVNYSVSKYSDYIIERGWYKKREHIYYLCGIVKYKNEIHVLASYSLKTKHLLIKNACEHIPSTNILKKFVNYCEGKYLKISGNVSVCEEDCLSGGCFSDDNSSGGNSSNDDSGDTHEGRC